MFSLEFGMQISSVAAYAGCQTLGIFRLVVPYEYSLRTPEWNHRLILASIVSIKRMAY